MPTVRCVIPSSRTLIASVAALAALGVCGAGPVAASTVPPDDDIATPDAINDAGEQSSTAPYRLEMFMEASILGMTIDGDTPLAVGEFDGDQSHMTMDLGAMFADLIPADEMPPELRGVDMVMEFVSDGTDLYIRAPFLASLAELEGADDDPTAQVFTQLGDGWGYVDGTAVPGIDAGSLTGTLGIGAADPAALFELLSDVEGAESIGTADIRGVSTAGVRAEVNLSALMEAQGTPVASTGDPFGNATFPIELWIDKDGFVRRIVMDMSGEAIADAVETAGEEVPTSMFGDMNMSITMEMFDYNAADIAIEIPTEFTDITDDFAEIVPPAGS
jgi:hypothetical protein